MTNKTQELRFFGRRKGKTIRPAREKLMSALMSKIGLKLPESGLFDFNQTFGIKPDRIWLEIGFGGGEHLAHQSKQNPTVGIIGAEPFLNGVASLLAHLNGSHETPVKHMDLEPDRSDNVRVWADDVRPVLTHCADGCFDRIFVLYPDPWPKARHAERRFMNQFNLKHMYRVLADDGELRMATDVVPYAEWALDQVEQSGLFQQINQNIHVPPVDWVPTRYEKKGIKAGRPLTYFIFKKKTLDER